MTTIIPPEHAQHAVDRVLAGEDPQHVLDTTPTRDLMAEDMGYTINADGTEYHRDLDRDDEPEPDDDWQHHVEEHQL